MSQFARTNSAPSTSYGSTRQIVYLGLIAVDPPEQIVTDRHSAASQKRTDGAEMTIVARDEIIQDTQNGIEAEKLTPHSSVLREMARKSPPPQEWRDEDFEGL